MVPQPLLLQNPLLFLGQGHRAQLGRALAPRQACFWLTPESTLTQTLLCHGERRRFASSRSRGRGVPAGAWHLIPVLPIRGPKGKAGKDRANAVAHLLGRSPGPCCVPGPARPSPLSSLPEALLVRPTMAIPLWPRAPLRGLIPAPRSLICVWRRGRQGSAGDWVPKSGNSLERPVRIPLGKGHAALNPGQG